MAQTGTIVLNGGGMRSLVAMSMAAQQRAPFAALFIHDSHPAEPHRYQTFLRQCERYEARRKLEIGLPHLGVSDSQTGGSQANRAPLARLQMLSAAAGLALQFRAQQLVWPILAGDNFDLASAATETVLAVRQMVQVYHHMDLIIETPLLELTWPQLIEIGQQMDVPWSMTRTCESDLPNPCGQCPACTLRASCFNEAGLEDPTPPATVHR